MHGVQIIFESEDIVAVSKHTPLPSVPPKPPQGPADNTRGTTTSVSKRDTPTSVLGLLQEELGTDLFAVHRIDQRVSGLIVFARSEKAAAEWSKLFAGSEVARQYWAICEAAPGAQSGRLEHRLLRDGRARKARVVATGGRYCALEYSVVGHSKSFALLGVTTFMGRFHQVRAQLAAAGAVIRGDIKYGARRSTKTGMIGLHTRALHFSALARSSGGRPPTLSAPAPSDPLWDLFTDSDKTP